MVLVSFLECILWFVIGVYGIRRRVATADGVDLLLFINNIHNRVYQTLIFCIYIYNLKVERFCDVSVVFFFFFFKGTSPSHTNANC